MVKLKLVKINKKLSTVKKLPRKLAEKSFLTFLILFLIVLSFTLILSYYYIFLAEISYKISQEEPLKLDREAQWRVLEEWQRRNQTFQAADFKEYPDIFN